MSFYEGARIVAAPLIRFIYGIKRLGIDNFPKNGPVIVCSNHRSNNDPLIIGASMPREMKFMAKEELFKIPVLNFIIKLMGAFPVHRGKNNSEAVKTSIKILNQGKVLAIFPEGTRQKQGGTPRPFKTGAALFAYKTHAVVVPAAIITKGEVRPFKRNIVRIGEPLSFEDLGFTDGSAENLHAVSNFLHDKVAELLGESSNQGEKEIV